MMTLICQHVLHTRNLACLCPYQQQCRRFDIGRAYIYANNDTKQSCVDAGDGRSDALFPCAPISGDRLSTMIPMNAKRVMMDLIAYAKFMLVLSQAI